MVAIQFLATTLVRNDIRQLPRPRRAGPDPRSCAPHGLGSRSGHYAVGQRLSAGNRIVKSTIDPTGTSLSIANSTPLAEMFSVSAEYAPAVCFYRRGKMQREARRTLHIFIVPPARLIRRYCSFGCHAEKNLSFRELLWPLRILRTLRAAYTGESGKQSYRSH